MTEAEFTPDDDSGRFHGATDQLTASAISGLLLHQRRMLSHLDVWLENRSDSEDVLQTYFEKALGAAGSLRDQEKVQAWFSRIMRNTAVDYMRSRTVGRNAQRRWAEEHEHVTLPVELEQSLCKCIHEITDDLGAFHREALQLVEWDDLSPQEAADRVGITANAFRVRLHRARAEMREKLLVICGLCAKHRCLDCWCKKDTGQPE